MADKLLDFVGKRKETIEKKRRNFERVLFQNFLGAYSVIDDNGSVYPVSLVDLSHDGCLFQVPWDVRSDKKFAIGTELTLRMYFTKKSFIPVVVKLRHGAEHIDDQGNTYMHYGCEFDKTLPSFQAMEHFINFMYKFAEHSSVDHEEHKVFFL
jgi:hypothetical protein